jgi:transcriptional repressor NrdR
LVVKCPFCGSTDLRVIDSRDVDEGIRRRRQCSACESRFTTYERPQLGGFYVVKRDHRREEFSKDKLLTGLHKACEKRPLPAGSVDKLAEDIEAELYGQGKVEIPSSTIGDMVMEKLWTLDNIAYIRFASVYRKFTDITELKKEVDNVLNRRSAPKLLSGSGQLSMLPDERRVGTLPKRRRR